jgi:release factor glutamine methyltransferase
MSSKSLFNQAFQTLKTATQYPETEIRSMLFLLFEKVFDLSKVAILADKPINSTTLQNEILEDALSRLTQAEPIQYVLGEMEFCGRIFQVNPAVLIPRPETEELVKHIVKDFKNTTSTASKTGLDIGTGSGCIAISLALEIPSLQMYAWDVSVEALQLAQKNARNLQIKVIFEQKDILLPNLSYDIQFDFIVSNPPYILETEKKLMQANVLEHEPQLALFVPDEKPLLFYEAITHFAKKHLKPAGTLYFEINERFGEETADLLIQNQFKEVQILQDMFGKDRFVKASL